MRRVEEGYFSQFLLGEGLGVPLVKRWRVFVANRSAFKFGGSVVSGCALYIKALFLIFFLYV